MPIFQALSIVIVTQNRAESLERAITSLLQQTVKPKELLIVDNNSTDHTKSVVQKFQKSKVLSIRHVLEKKNGYPAIYNAGLKNAASKWVSFIDDDCVADQHWVSEIRRTTVTHPNAAVILGESKTRSPQNIFSFTTLVLDQDWKKNGIQAIKVIDYEILDNKNIVYNKPFLTKNHISFDESRSKILGGAAEDCDLGKQIEMAKGVAIYHSKAIVYHQDPISFSWFWKRYVKSYAAYLHFREKWPNKTQLPRKQHSLKTRTTQLLDDQQATGSYRAEVYLFLSGVVGFSMMLTYLMKFRPLRNACIQLAEKM